MSALEVHGIDHVVVRVADLDRALAFYEGALGCAVERRLDDLGLVQLRAGASLIDLVPLASPLGRAGGAGPGPEGHNVDHFALRIATWNLRRLWTAAGNSDASSWEAPSFCSPSPVKWSGRWSWGRSSAWVAGLVA